MERESYARTRSDLDTVQKEQEVFCTPGIKVVAGKPPNYAEIAAKWRLPEGVVFTYGDTVYTKDGYCSDHVLVHEAVHVRQQAKYGGPGYWWIDYLDDPGFRLKQEIEAYQAQWVYIEKTRGRSEKRGLLSQLSADLAGPMYGNLLTRKQAKELIQNGDTG